MSRDGIEATELGVTETCGPSASAKLPSADGASEDGASGKANISERLRETARLVPDQPAVIMPPRTRCAERRITFGELDRQVDRVAQGLNMLGVAPGHRMVLMVRPGIEFILLTFGLFRSGATVVLIDPGMGVRRVLRCLAEVDPDGFVAVPVVHAVRRLRRRLFPNARFNVCVGRNWAGDAIPLERLLEDTAGGSPRCVTSSTAPAAIIFTSGGTGPPKGVVYEHGMFAAQVDMLRSQFSIRPGEVDLPGFPLFALFNAAMQVTTIVPDMDPTHPARVEPRRILDPIRQYGVTQAFGSPALWNRVGRQCEKTSETIPNLKRALSAGAPVPLHVLNRMRRALADPGADLHTPYGATEALPVATISASEVLTDRAIRTQQGAGTCVGRPFPQVRIKIIEMTGGPIPSLDAAHELPRGSIGEIIVSSPSATREYFRRPQETMLAKIADRDGFWHRMGDVGYLDEEGRLWFCGRKAHVVETAGGRMFPVCCEAIFNEHPDVYRSALVGVGPAGRRRPVIVVEPEQGRFPRGRARTAFHRALGELGRENTLTERIDTFLFHRSLPVDIRHNIKIDRERLGRWAAKRLGVGEGSP